MTESEQLVYDLCRKSFLSLWSYPTPYRGDGNELCDAVVLCSPDVIIFSVKDTEYKDTRRTAIDEDRWKRKAIDESSKIRDSRIPVLPAMLKFQFALLAI